MKNLISIILITIFSITVSLPLVKPGFHQIHDDQQITRLYLFDQSLKSGQFPVRWVDGLGFGFGYPLFVFYPPLVYMIGEIYHLIGFGFIDSTKLAFFTSIVASGVAMFIFAKEIWGRYAALTGAIFYILVPYRALDIYVRGALAESFSFVWLPLILWSFYKLQNTGKSVYVYTSAIFLALLMITHNLIFLPFILLLPFYLLFLLWKSENKKRFFVNCQLSIVICFSLSAFFWLPALLEKKFTIVDQLLLVNLASYKIHFVYPQQLWNWAWGFGGSAAGLADGISFKIGKLHILASIAALLLAIIHLIKTKFSNGQLPALQKSQHETYSNRIEKSSAKIWRVNCQLSTVFFALFLISAFLTTFYSQFIWELIPPLGYLQFPWRLLTFTALFSSILAGAFVYLLKVPILRLVVTIILVILVFAPNLKLFKPQFYRENLTDQIATSKEVINWDISSSSFEYLPKGVELTKSNLGTNIINIKKEDIPNKKVIVINPQAEINNLIIKPHEVSFSINSPTNSQIRANIFNFPGWQAQIDDQIVEVDDNNKLKLIDLNIPAGKHRVTIEFRNTPVRQMGNLISLFSFALILILIAKQWRTKTF